MISAKLKISAQIYFVWRLSKGLLVNGFTYIAYIHTYIHTYIHAGLIWKIEKHGLNLLRELKKKLKFSNRYVPNTSTSITFLPNLIQLLHGFFQILVSYI